MGLARRAGKVVLGFSAVRSGVEKGGVKLVVMAGDISGHTAEKVQRLCARNQVDCFFAADRYRLGKAVGREDQAVVGVVPGDLASAISKRVSSVDR